MAARLAAATSDVDGMMRKEVGAGAGVGFPEADGVGEEGNVPTVPPEIDVTDLVMDNNDYYTQASRVLFSTTVATQKEKKKNCTRILLNFFNMVVVRRITLETKTSLSSLYIYNNNRLPTGTRR